jgi:hypothetical protein
MAERNVITPTRADYEFLKNLSANFDFATVPRRLSKDQLIDSIMAATGFVDITSV